MKRVTGLGGVFFKTANPKETLDWYRRHLGIESDAWGGFAFRWLDREQPEETGYTVWSAFPRDTRYFAPSEHELMVNFRVADLEGLLAALREEGVEVVGDVSEEANGKFGWILDPDGRKIELWEPVPSREDPYL
jgi:catechol 2,3-dioxygenase-like lactoylglutathione lyase family enzyme